MKHIFVSATTNIICGLSGSGLHVYLPLGDDFEADCLWFSWLRKERVEHI